LTANENDHPFVECATFADDNKYSGESWQSPYHYVDIPWFAEGSKSDYKVQTSQKNITQGIHDIVNWLANNDCADLTSNYVYTYLNKKYPSRPDLAKSYALRLLIHFVGDIMQPLHCEARYTATTPDGDAGGNDFPLKSHYNVDNLHSLIDKVLYLEKDTIARPLSESSWTLLETKSEIYRLSVEDVCCWDRAVWDNRDFKDWQWESFQLAKGLYDGLTED